MYIIEKIIEIIIGLLISFLAFAIPYNAYVNNFKWLTFIFVGVYIIGFLVYLVDFYNIFIASHD